jgi:EAL domain
MGLQVIAEGIEDLDQADWLREHGCAMAQGYAFGRPAPLPNPADVLLAQLDDASAEDVASELTAEPLELPALPEPRALPERKLTDLDDTGAFATGTLFDELADPDDD